MAMDIRKQRKLVNIPDENMKMMKNVKMNQTKAPNEMKRAVLGDIAANKLHAGALSATNNSTLYRSKLPVLKVAYPKLKTNASSKSKAVDLKENQDPSISVKVDKPSTVTSIIDKTKTLKLEALKQKTIVFGIQNVGRDHLEEVQDIDRNDHKNPFLVAAYAKEIFSYLKHLENTHPIREDYLKNRNITPKMRAILIDWLVEVQQEYHLLQETLHIGVGILDTYLQEKPDVDRHHMQLIGVTALFLASKYEEICVPPVKELVYISATAFQEEDLHEMEQEMFKAIKFDLSRPISLSFLRRYSKAAGAQTIQHTFAKYFLDLSLLEYSLCHVKPSLIAAAALCLALFVTGGKEKIDETLWTRTLEYYSEYKFSDLKSVLKILARITYTAKNSDFKAVYQKYSSTKVMKVSQNAELTSKRMKMLAVSE